MLTNLSMPNSYAGPGAYVYPVLANPGGALIFVLASIGSDNPRRLTFQGTAATVTQSNSAQGPYGDPNKPLASVFGTNGALSYCQSGRGDVIIVLPGHTESLTANSTYTVPAGVNVLCLGYGPSRPTFTFAGGTATLIALAAGSRFDNGIVAVGTDATVSLFTLAAGARLLNNRLMQASATIEATSGVTITGDYALVANNTIDSTLHTGAAQGVYSVSTCIGVQILDNYILGDFSAANIKNLTLHWTECLIKGNTLVNRAAAAPVLNLTTASTGVIRDNFLGGTTWSALTDALVNTSSVQMRFGQNFGLDDVTIKSGILTPAAGTVT